jgi:pimeloyl-ACP methyl ester carboxylesterase
MRGRKGIALLLVIALAAALSVIVGSVVLCENVVHVPPSHRPQPDSAVAADLARETGAAWRAVEIVAGDGTPLRAWWFVPRNPVHAAVILLHGITDSRRGVLGQARLLLRHDFAVLAPDSRGHGVSGGDLITYGVQEADDVHRWVGWMSGAAHAEKLYGLGESMGAAVLLQSLAVEPRFRAVVAECPFATLEEISYYRVDRLAHVTALGRVPSWPFVQGALLYAKSVYKLDFTQASPARAVRSTRVPILLIHGTADVNIPPEHSRILHALNPQSTELWEVPDAVHVSALSAQPQAYEEKVVEWFQH